MSTSRFGIEKKKFCSNRVFVSGECRAAPHTTEQLTTKRSEKKRLLLGCNNIYEEEKSYALRSYAAPLSVSEVSVK